MLKIDLHIHSVFSAHAFPTLYEIAAEAAQKEMELVAITDHGPSMLGVPGPISFSMGFRMPKKINGVRVLLGCEANIINQKGDLDISKTIQERLDLVLCSLHQDTSYKDLGYQGNTQAIINALRNPFVKIFTHPLHLLYEYDRDAVLNAAIDNNVLLELNLTYLKYFPEDLSKVKAMIKLVREKRAKVIVNSDAHFLHEIGDDTSLLESWKDLDLSEDLIINNYPLELKTFLGIE